VTVEQLIAALKKLPPNAKIALVDHDQNYHAGEMNGALNRVEEAPPAIKLRGFGAVLL
jgi:hypothetical protein